jgi:hypothetical protein
MNRSALQLALALFAVFSPLPHPAFAQEADVSPISTERPTAGYSPDVIPGGSLQLENGADLSAQRKQFTADLPETLLRFGFFDRFEVRYQASNAFYASHSSTAQPKWQTADTQISGKALIGHPNGLGPRSAVLSLSIPTGGASETSGSHDPGAALIWTQAPPHGYFINEVAIATLTTLNGARRPLWAPSVAAGKALNAKLAVFAECAPTVLQNNAVTWLADGGFTFVRRATRQLDFRGGVLKDSTGVHTLISVGISVRRDNLLKTFQSAPITR